MEKRKHQRVSVKNLDVNISDGWGFFSGTVSDLSRLGIKIDDIPKRLNENSEKLSVVISANGKHFKMSVRPRWSSPTSVSKKVGLEIVHAPFGWTEFVMDHEPDTDDDWAEVIM